jgi:divalent metal cation (Fe/Co/Zn/Cd) transporter
VIVHLEPRREGLTLRERALAVALAEPLVLEAHDITIYEHDGRSILSLHLKLAPDVSIADAHAVAKLVEATLCREPGVEDVHTHLEPLEQPAVPPDMALADAHELASRLEDDIRAAQPHMQDVVVHTEP